MYAFEQVPIQSVQTFWDTRPCNIRHSPQPVGTKEYFDEVERRKYLVEPHIPHFAEFAKWSGKRVLEIGCGIGTDTINFARAGAQVTAIDLSPKSLEVAKTRAEVFGLSDRIRFYCGNSEEMCQIVPIDAYDLVYSFGVIHHTPHPERVVEQIKQYLPPHGELRLMVYSRVSYKLFAIMREEKVWDMARIDKLIARNSEAQTGCPVTYTYTPESIHTLLRGFEVLDIRKAHIFTWDVEAYKKYEYKKDVAWQNVSDAELAELERELGWHMLVRARIAS